MMGTWFLGMALAKLGREEGRQKGVGKRGKERNGRKKWKEKEELNQWVFGCLMIVTGALSKGGKVEREEEEDEGWREE